MTPRSHRLELVAREVSGASPRSVQLALASSDRNARPCLHESHFVLSTPGGMVMSGVTLYNVLRAMPFRLTTLNAGNVDSIGNAVCLAGERRYAAAQGPRCRVWPNRDLRPR